MHYWKLGFSQRRPLPKLSGTAINGINRAVNKIHKASRRYQNKKTLTKDLKFICETHEKVYKESKFYSDYCCKIKCSCFDKLVTLM